MEHFFQDAFEKMDAESRESFFRTIFLQDPSEYAAQVRIAYYREKLGHMGEDVQIGVGVRLGNPQWIHLGNHVHLSDHCTLIARGPGGITLGDGVRLQDRVYLDTESREEGYIRVENDVYIGTGTTLPKTRRTGIFLREDAFASKAPSRTLPKTDSGCFMEG